MKNILVILLLVSVGLTSCEPALYITFDNHTGAYSSMNVYLDEPNSYFKMKEAGVKKIEFTTTAINAVVEYSYGAGTWDAATIDELVKGISKIEFVSGNNSTEFTEKEAIRALFEENVHGKDRNGIRIKVE
ncbi:MAG: hypothetical protein R2753_08940 [Chitinophagales bacterium]